MLPECLVGKWRKRYQNHQSSSQNQRQIFTKISKGPWNTATEVELKKKKTVVRWEVKNYLVKQHEIYEEWTHNQIRDKWKNMTKARKGMKK